uniref:Uncharacterized protein n=1 Tax=Arundo donax TaxID=35708 RepID=A0A0A9HH75_ARUDO
MAPTISAASKAVAASALPRKKVLGECNSDLPQEQLHHHLIPSSPGEIAHNKPRCALRCLRLSLDRAPTPPVAAPVASSHGTRHSFSSAPPPRCARTPSRACVSITSTSSTCRCSTPTSRVTAARGSRSPSRPSAPRSVRLTASSSACPSTITPSQLASTFTLHRPPLLALSSCRVSWAIASALRIAMDKVLGVNLCLDPLFLQTAIPRTMFHHSPIQLRNLFLSP